MLGFQYTSRHGYRKLMDDAAFDRGSKLTFEEQNRRVQSSGLTVCLGGMFLVHWVYRLILLSMQHRYAEYLVP